MQSPYTYNLLILSTKLKLSCIRLGLKIALADADEARLIQAGKEIEAIVGESNVLVIPTDVSKIEEVVRLRDKVYETWGEVRLRTGS